jgi:hypothetical protein
MDAQRGCYRDVNAQKRDEDSWNGDEPGCCQPAATNVDGATYPLANMVYSRLPNISTEDSQK